MSANEPTTPIGLYYPDGSFKSRDKLCAEAAVRQTSIEFITPIHHPPDSFEWWQQRAVEAQVARNEAVGRPEHAEVQLWSNAPVIIGLIGDVHAGGEDCDYQEFYEDVKFIKEHPLAYTLLFGDLTDSYFFTPAVHEHLINLQEQYGYTRAAIDELNGKIIAAWAGNHCLDEETELWTRNGWKHYQEVDKDDEVVSINTITGFAEYSPIQRIIAYPFRGKMNHVRTVSVDMMTTDDHRLFYRRRRTNKYEYMPMSEYMGRKDTTSIGIVRAGKSGLPEIEMPDSYIKLAAWILADGHMSKKRCGITQRPEKAHLVEDVLVESGIHFAKVVRKRFCENICGKYVGKTCETVDFSIRTRKDIDFIVNLLEGTKKRFPSWVWELSDRQFDVFLDSLIDGDGSRVGSGSACVFYQKNKTIIDELQVLCAMHERKTSIYEYGDKQCRLNISRGNTTRLYKSKRDRIGYDGIVWDLTVPNSNFLVRRNGKAYFTGNCLWASRMGETFYQGWTERYNAHYFEGVAYLTVRVNDQQYNIVGSHAHRGFSIFSFDHSAKRQVMDDAEGADISITAHNHVKANSRQAKKVHGGSARLVDYIALGSYSRSSTYSRVKGWHDKASQEMGATFIVLFHDRKRVEVFNNREEAADRVAPYLR